jgi:hypothetical protein
LNGGGTEPGAPGKPSIGVAASVASIVSDDIGERAAEVRPVDTARSAA